MTIKVGDTVYWRGYGKAQRGVVVELHDSPHWIPEETPYWLDRERYVEFTIATDYIAPNVRVSLSDLLLVQNSI